jgi:phosphodiesterase/alkaline phosphatase D-like protein
MKKSNSFYKILAAVLLALAFLLFVVALGALLLGCSKTADNFKAFNQADGFNIRQVITADSATSRTVMWQSETEEKDAFVEYRVAKTDGAKAGGAVTQAKSSTQKERFNETFKDNGKTSVVHTVTLQNLQPGTEYEYRLGCGDKRSEWFRLTTAETNKYKALIFPDSQSANYKSWENVAMPAWQRNQDARFFIIMGDLVDNGEHAYQWNEWFTRVRPMITRIPVAPVMGNHETYTSDWKVRMPLAYLHYFQLPEGAPEKYRNQFYSFDYGDVHFVVLNNLMREMDQFQPDMLQEQLAWFRADMEKTKKKWKIVLMHKDVLRYGFLTRKTPRTEGISEEGKIFMPLFDQYGVDVVLTAHLHTYRNRGRIYNFERSDKGPLYILTGVAGDVRYPNLWKSHSLDVALAPQPETNNYMVMEADSGALQFCCYLPDGKKVDEAVVKK